MMLRFEPTAHPMLGKFSTPEVTLPGCHSLAFEKDVSRFLSLHIQTKQCGVKAADWNPCLFHPRTLFPSCQDWTPAPHPHPAKQVSSGLTHLAADWRGAKYDRGLVFYGSPVGFSPGPPGLGGRLRKQGGYVRFVRKSPEQASPSALSPPGSPW